MKKLIFGAMTALVISGSAFAADTAKATKEVDVKQMQTYCRVTVTVRNPDGTVKSSNTTNYPVSSGAEGAAQCNAIKNKVIASLAAN